MMKLPKSSLERFIDEIVHSAGFLVATHNNFAGGSLGHKHQHSDLYQISYYLKGEDRVLVGNRHYAVKAGDLFFIPPHCIHGSVPGDSHLRFEMLQIKFRLRRALPSPLPVYVRVKYPADLLSAFHSLINEFHMGRAQRETMMRLNLAQMVLLIQRKYSLQGPGYHLPPLKAGAAGNYRLAEERLAKVISYLQANYTRELSLAEIARINGYSVSTLCHVFKQQVGISPAKYLSNYRLSRALEMMGCTERKLEDIAFRTGFKSVYYFSRLFKKRYNQSPRRYARLIYNSPE